MVFLDCVDTFSPLKLGKDRLSQFAEIDFVSALSNGCLLLTIRAEVPNSRPLVVPLLNAAKPLCRQFEAFSLSEVRYIDCCKDRLPYVSVCKRIGNGGLSDEADCCMLFVKTMLRLTLLREKITKKSLRGRSCSGLEEKEGDLKLLKD